MASIVLAGIVRGQRWEQSFAAGYYDGSGNYAGGSEIMHLVTHKGRLYAFNGYWEDIHYPGQSAQVLRLDSADGIWEVDLDTGADGIPYLKGNILKSVTFSLDKQGNHLPAPITLLIAAAGTYVNGSGLVSVFVRNDVDGHWKSSVVQSGSSAGGVRWVPRDMEMYRDPATGLERLFLLLGNPGIISGVYDPESGEIEWDDAPEYPVFPLKLSARPLGIAAANGNLYFSAGGSIYQRINESFPGWKIVYTISGNINQDAGGIRGLTNVPNPRGPDESLIFVWTPDGSSKGEVRRLDGTGLEEHTETNLSSLFNREQISGSAKALFSLGGYNRFLPVRVPGSSDTVYIAGFEQRISSSDASVVWNNYYRGGMYAIRNKDLIYSVGEVNGGYDPFKPVLVAPRTYTYSPFPGEENVLYFGGFDANFYDATGMAWIFKAPVSMVLNMHEGTGYGSGGDPGIRIFTDPSLGLIHIRGIHYENTSIEIYNICGQLIRTAQVFGPAHFVMQNGIYLIRVSGREYIHTCKLVL